MKQVYLVTEYEPEHGEFPTVVVAVFSTSEKADTYIRTREAERADGGQNAEELYWDWEVAEVQ